MEINLDDKDAVFNSTKMLKIPLEHENAATRSGENSVNIVKWVNYEFWSHK